MIGIIGLGEWRRKRADPPPLLAGIAMPIIVA
jgi:hypothetical protein